MFDGRGRGRGRRGGGGRGFPAGRALVRGGSDIGGRGVGLSDRFNRLHVKNTAIAGRDIRRVSTQQLQRNKRDVQQQAFRKGGNVGAAVKGIKFKTEAQGRGRGRGGGRGRGVKIVRGGRGRGRGRGRGDGEKKPMSKDALDAQMDDYHFKAGKGPDPKVLKAQRAKSNLDNEMDSYWAAKEKSAAAAAATTAAEA